MVSAIVPAVTGATRWADTMQELTGTNLRQHPSPGFSLVDQRVALVAMSVDPERDTQAALRAFSARFGLAENPGWLALTGTRPELAPVWKSYGIEPGDFLHEERHGEGHRQTPDGHTASSSPEMLSHTDAIDFIDPDGEGRALLRGDASPESIAQNPRAMLEAS